MDSLSGYSDQLQPRSGGKIVRPRRTSVVRTPYDRPTPRDPPQQNPSWISRLVYKPASVIASGAGKLISSVVFSDSSYSSSEGEDSSSDIEGDEDVEKNITDEDLVSGQESTFQRLSSKRVIEQLLMQETFAREDGDRLIDIIKARVVDHPNVPASNEGMHNGLTSEVNVGEMSSKAVMEAKRWLEEKKSASNSKSKGNEDGAGSPVDVAKSYMRARLPWGSPSVSNSEFWSPPSAGTPFPYSAGNLSSSKLKRRSRSNPSWNIQDEIRKVRAKATEEMLKTVTPSSVASLEPKQSPYVVPTSEQNQATEANQAVKDTNPAPQSGTGVNDSNGDTTNAVLALGASMDPTENFCIPKDVFETSKEADEVGAARHTSNGFLSSSPSSPVGTEGEPKPKPPEETEASQPIAETPGDDITIENGSEGGIDIENHNSDSSTHEEEWLPGDQSLPNSNSASSSPGTSKVLAYTRRGRGRGRGVRGKGRGK